MFLQFVSKQLPFLSFVCFPLFIKSLGEGSLGLELWQLFPRPKVFESCTEILLHKEHLLLQQVYRFNRLFSLGAQGGLCECERGSICVKTLQVPSALESCHPPATRLTYLAFHKTTQEEMEKNSLANGENASWSVEQRLRPQTPAQGNRSQGFP